MAAAAAHRGYLSDVLARQVERRRLIDPNHAFPPPPALAGPSRTSKAKAGTGAVASKQNVANYVAEEETVRNDYAEWYGVSGEWSSNFILGAGDAEVCEEYPALRKLMDLKGHLVENTSHPPLYACVSSTDSGSPNSLPTPQQIQEIAGGSRFDTILITPPENLDWNQIASLPLRNISADPGFVFLWVGQSSEDGLERGRECFAKWGFRRAEDIVWVKTNKGVTDGSAAGGTVLEAGNSSWKRDSGRDEGGLFVGQKEHCLMGIRGTVRRSTDSRFVHCNVDTDIIVWGDSGNSEGPRHPPYLQTLAENFCLGTRRLHIFGSPSTARRGWVSIGMEPLTSPPEKFSDNVEPATGTPRVQKFKPEEYLNQAFRAEDGRFTVPFHNEIDSLRPKSPTRKGRNAGPSTSSPMPYNRQSDTPNLPGFPPPNHFAMTQHGAGPQRFHQPPRQMQPQFQPQQQFQQQFQHHQPTGQPGQPQFDPFVLAQAQAQAQAAIQAQMQMAMMQQMQAQMGGMGMGMGMGQMGIPGMVMGQMGQGMGMAPNVGQYGMPPQMGFPGNMGGMGNGTGGGPMLAGNGMMPHQQHQMQMQQMQIQQPQGQGGQWEQQQGGGDWQMNQEGYDQGMGE